MKTQLKEDIVQLLRARFRGLDFWRLSMPYKDKHYNAVADELLLDHVESLVRIKQLESIILSHDIELPDYANTDQVLSTWQRLKSCIDADSLE